MLDVAPRACPHGPKHALQLLVGRTEMKRRGLIVIDGSKPVTLCCQEITAVEGGIGALMAGVGHPSPFPIPGVLIPWIYPACGKEAFGSGRTALLSRSQQPHKLERELFIFRPIDPSSGIKLKSHVDEMCRSRRAQARRPRKRGGIECFKRPRLACAHGPASSASDIGSDRSPVVIRSEETRQRCVG